MKKFTTCFLVIVMCLLPTVFSGCRLEEYSDPWSYKKEENGFYYYVVGDNGYSENKNTAGAKAIILGLANEETERDELVIPEKLGGYPIVQVGEVYQRYKASSSFYGIKATKIKKIVIKHNLETLLGCGIINFEGDLLIDASIENYRVPSGFVDDNVNRINSVQIDYKLDSFPSYVPFKYLNEYGLGDMLFHKGIVFESNGGEQRTYAYVIRTGALVNEPEQPQKSGYTFAGWYTDETYETQWNFEEDTVTQNMTLYAKWIEN